MLFLNTKIPGSTNTSKMSVSHFNFNDYCKILNQEIPVLPSCDQIYNIELSIEDQILNSSEEIQIKYLINMNKEILKKTNPALQPEFIFGTLKLIKEWKKLQTYPLPSINIVKFIAQQ